MLENDLLAKYKSVPLLTRSLMTATVVLSLAVSTNTLKSQVLMLHWPSIVHRFHVNKIVVYATLEQRQKSQMFKDNGY